MITFDETITVEKDGHKITNNIELSRIIVDDNIYKDYCILGQNNQGIIILQAGTVQTLTEVPNAIHCIIEALLTKEAPKKIQPQKDEQKTKKTQKTQNKNTKK